MARVMPTHWPGAMSVPGTYWVTIESSTHPSPYIREGIANLSGGCDMALTTCPDCGREVSQAAKACPGCGRPVTVAVQTIEQTGKDWKVAQAVGAGGMLVGVPTCFASPDGGAVLILLGMMVYTVGRLGAWWRHG